MGVVSYPALLVAPGSWLPRGSLELRHWLELWEPWQYAGACLPRAVHLAQAKRRFADEFGPLRVGLAMLSAEQNRAMAAHVPGRMLAPEPWTAPVPVEDVYQYAGGPGRWAAAAEPPDPADALTVLLTGAAIRIQASGDDEGAIAVGAGAALAGICSGLADMVSPDETRPGEFARLWAAISKLAETGRITPGEWPETLAAVPAWVASLPDRFPDVFKTIPVS